MTRSFIKALRKRWGGVWGERGGFLPLAAAIAMIGIARFGPYSLEHDRQHIEEPARPRRILIL
jgi:hypothetical protein